MAQPQVQVQPGQLWGVVNAVEAFPISQAISRGLDESAKAVGTKVTEAEVSIACVQEAIQGAMTVVKRANEKIHKFRSDLDKLAQSTRKKLEAAQFGTTDNGGSSKSKRGGVWKLLAVGSVILLLAALYFGLTFVDDMKQYRIKGIDSDEATWAFLVPLFLIGLGLLALSLKHKYTINT